MRTIRNKNIHGTIKVYLTAILLAFLCLSVLHSTAQAGLSQEDEKCIRDSAAEKILSEGETLTTIIENIKASGKTCDDKDEIIRGLERNSYFLHIITPVLQVCCQTASNNTSNEAMMGAMAECFKEGTPLLPQIEADTIYSAMCEGLLNH